MKKVITKNRACPNCGGIDSCKVSSGYDYEYNSCCNEFNFVFCNNCALLYLNPAPVMDEMQNIYPADYKPFHFNRGRKSLVMSIRNKIESRKASVYRNYLNDEAKILDVGSGDGRYMKILKQIKNTPYM